MGAQWRPEGCRQCKSSAGDAGDCMTSRVNSHRVFGCIVKGSSAALMLLAPRALEHAMTGRHRRSGHCGGCSASARRNEHKCHELMLPAFYMLWHTARWLCSRRSICRAAITIHIHHCPRHHHQQMDWRDCESYTTVASAIRDARNHTEIWLKN